MSLHSNFWDNVDKCGSDECWEWTAGKHKDGYGHLKVQGKMKLAHRVVISLLGCDIPEGLQVLHHCDNPPCVNPKHLFFGTHDDNMKDKAKKCRVVTKLTAEEVACIRRVKGQFTYTRLGEIFGVTRSNIGYISRGDSWRQL